MIINIFWYLKKIFSLFYKKVSSLLAYMQAMILSLNYQTRQVVVKNCEKMNITINNRTVTTAKELMAEMVADGQGSGTLQGMVNVDGVEMWCRKHWSYSGGFPLCSDQSLTDDLGELVLENDAYVDGDGNGRQYIYDTRGTRISDAAIVGFKKA